MPSLLSCFPVRRPTATQVDDPLLPSSSAEQGKLNGCIFCSASKEKGFSMVYEDDKLLAFHDRSPQARLHLLVIPQSHVGSVKTLTPSHLPLLRSMISLAHTLVPPDPPPKMGFHIPPFSSVPHLHMHVFSGPHTLLGRFKYPVSSRGDQKGVGWFVSASQVESILQRGGRVSLGSG